VHAPPDGREVKRAVGGDVQRRDVLAQDVDAPTCKRIIIDVVVIIMIITTMIITITIIIDIITRSSYHHQTAERWKEPLMAMSSGEMSSPRMFMRQPAQASASLSSSSIIIIIIITLLLLLNSSSIVILVSITSIIIIIIILLLVLLLPVPSLLVSLVKGLKLSHSASGSRVAVLL
jgi:hypothetical protein